MISYKDFPILVIDNNLDADNGDGRAVRDIIDHLDAMDFSVMESREGSDAKSLLLSHTEISCVLVDWELGQNGQTGTPTCADIIKTIRDRNDKIQIFVMTEKHKVQEISLDILSQTEGYIWKMEDTPQFIAGRLEQAAKAYLDSLMPPFFKELVKYTEEYKYAWHTPGHMGGLAFLKSPAGRVFFDFFGENVFRADLSVSVGELGSLMEHAGVNGEAEAQAAKTFGAEQTYFVTNGTSTANKMVMMSCVTPGDVVLVDRNCHKSLQHAITMSGATPIYLIPSRNAYGIIGGIHENEFDAKTIKKKIESCSLIQDKAAPVKLCVVTNSTYDGLIYNVVSIKEKLKDVVENLHFDEAWYPYANFNPIYDDRYAMCTKHDANIHPALFATQSTHKLLAAFSQASMVHIKSGANKVDPDRFNEAFMMHTSTSPQYSIIASLDVASKMMEGKAGQALVQDSIDEAIIFRKKMDQIGEELATTEPDSIRQWWFSAWQPEGDKSSKPECWTLKPQEEWHGFPGMEENFIMLDPIKVTILSPGICVDGSMEKWGIPAPLVSRFLCSRGITVEKTGLYTFLVLFSIGITKGKSSTLLTELFEFKKLYDNNAPLDEVFPDLVAQHPERYKGVRLKELCDQMHESLIEADIARITEEVFSILPDQELTPSEAYYELVKGKVEEVPLNELQGRIPAVMLVPYPPGIPIIMPGEKFTAPTQGIIDYLALFENFDNNYPGFETETHGISLHRENNRTRYYVNCVVR